MAAIAGSDPAKAADIARQSGIPSAFAHWSELVDSDGIDAVAIATPPKLQPEIAVRAMKNGKAVFLGRFKVVSWLPAYLRWFGYAFATTFLRRPPSTVAMKAA